MHKHSMKTTFEKTSLTRPFNGVRIVLHYTSYKQSSQKFQKKNVYVAQVATFTNFHQTCA